LLVEMLLLFELLAFGLFLDGLVVVFVLYFGDILSVLSFVEAVVQVDPPAGVGVLGGCVVVERVDLV
jgi:hypothetical protein